jgi:hypothetical protein
MNIVRINECQSNPIADVWCETDESKLANLMITISDYLGDPTQELDEWLTARYGLGVDDQYNPADEYPEDYWQDAVHSAIEHMTPAQRSDALADLCKRLIERRRLTPAPALDRGTGRTAQHTGARTMRNISTQPQRLTPAVIAKLRAAGFDYAGPGNRYGYALSDPSHPRHQEFIELMKKLGLPHNAPHLRLEAQNAGVEALNVS